MGLGGKLKRKDIDQVNDDFSDFSLSSPATKIRRLDAELPPIIEEDEPFVENHEKAIVLFNPLHHNLRSPSTLSFSLNSDLFSGFKNQFLRESAVKLAELEDETESEQSNEAKQGCLAVIPWVPCQIPSVESSDGQVEQEVADQESSLMEGDEMDIEEESNNNSNNLKREQEQEFAYGYGGFNLKPGEAFLQHWPQQQQQQHCMVAQPPQNPFTSPITWSQ